MCKGERGRPLFFYIFVTKYFNKAMMIKYFIFLLIFINSKIMAQPTIQGEYIFSRQEMVAGFNFSADGKFEFFMPMAL